MSWVFAQHTHCCAKFDWYGICLLPHLAAHVKAYLGDFARGGWSSWGLSLIFRHEMLGSAFDSRSPLSSHSATRDRLSFHFAFLLLRPCLRQDNSPRWTTAFWQGGKLDILRVETFHYCIMTTNGRTQLETWEQCDHALPKINIMYIYDKYWYILAKYKGLSSV